MYAKGKGPKKKRHKVGRKLRMCCPKCQMKKMFQEGANDKSG